MSAYEELDDAVHGDVLAAGAEGFDDAVRAFNSALQHDAEIVVLANDAADVSTAVTIARRHGLPVLTQSSGHGPLRPTARGVLVRTSRMNDVEIDTDRRTARVGAGALWGELLDACAEHGLVPLGLASVANVGVAGYLLGGGMGPLGRTDGFGSDHVLAIELVDAEGGLRTVDAEHDPDLFWTFRGGKIVPGVATAFTVRLATAPQLFAATLTYARDDVPDALAAFAEWQRDLADHSTGIANLMRFPDIPQLPEQLRGKRFLQVDLIHVGGEESGRAELDRLTALRAPATSGTKIVDPATWMREAMAPPPGPSLQLGMLVREFTTDVAREIVDIAGPETDTPWQVIEMRPFGGALGRPGPTDTAVGGRTDGVLISCVAMAPNGFAGLREAFGLLRDRLDRWFVPGVNVAFNGPDSPDTPLRNAWSDDVRRRLSDARAEYDPTGVFMAPPD